MDQTTSMSWNRLRILVKKRDHSKCYHCGKVDDKGHCDHLLPLSKGGTDSILNLVWSCQDCNLKKSNKVNFKPQLESNRIRPNFDWIIPSLKELAIKLFIPSPYYTYDQIRDLEIWFDTIEIQSTTPIISWLRHRIWPMPGGVLTVIQAQEELKNLRKYWRVGPSVQNFEKCRFCDSNIFITQEGEKFFTWFCCGGHRGCGGIITKELFSEYAKKYTIQWLRIELFYEPKFQPFKADIVEIWKYMQESESLPDWLRD